MRRTKNKIPKLHVAKGDQVRVLSGKNRGASGRILRVLPKQQKAVVEGVNMITKHVKPNQNNPNGDRITMEAPLHVSKLMLLEGGVPTRVGRKKTENGWVRVSKRTGKEMPTQR